MDAIFEILISVNCLLLQQTLIVQLLCAKYPSKHWGYVGEQNRPKSCYDGEYILLSVPLESNGLNNIKYSSQRNYL